MPIPKIPLPIPKLTENERRLEHIRWTLACCMDYDIDGARDIIRVIEENHLNKSQFEYPYNSYDEFKKHVLAGDYDIDVDSMLMTNKERKERNHRIKEGKTCISFVKSRTG